MEGKNGIVGEMTWAGTRVGGKLAFNSTFTLLGYLKNYVCQFKNSKTKVVFILSVGLERTFPARLAFPITALSP